MDMGGGGSKRAENGWTSFVHGPLRIRLLFCIAANTITFGLMKTTPILNTRLIVAFVLLLPCRGINKDKPSLQLALLSIRLRNSRVIFLH